MAEKHLCMSCGHVGYLVYLHNDEHCEECYSRNTVEWEDEVKGPKRVLVKSTLGLLGAIELVEINSFFITNSFTLSLYKLCLDKMSLK